MTDGIESRNWSFFGLQFGRPVRLTTPAPIMALSIAHKEAPEPPDRGRAQLAIGRHEVDAFLIGTPLGLGILLALGIVMVAMSHLSQ
jgi:hypothetical protein